MPHRSAGHILEPLRQMILDVGGSSGYTAHIFERWNDPARLLVVLAQQVALDRGALSVHSGHVLLGLRCLSDEVIATALDEVGMPRIPTPPDQGTPEVHLPIDPETRNALRRSREESRAFGDAEVQPGHVLLAILPTEPAAAELAKYGADLVRLRARVIELLAQGTERP